MQIHIWQNLHFFCTYQIVSSMTLCLLTDINELFSILRCVYLNLACMADGQNKRKKLKLLSIGIAPHDALLSIGISPHGLISIGAIPHGLISIGLVPMGVVSIGLVSMGLFSAGMISMGLIAFGRVNMSLMQLNPIGIQQNQPGTEMNPHHNMSH